MKPRARTGEFKRDLDRFAAKAARLQEHARFSPGDPELTGAVEELCATVEELREQNEKLLEVQGALAAERRRYRDLFEFATAGLVVTDIKGAITEANRAAASLLGLSQRHLIGKSLRVFIAEPDHAAFYSLLQRLQQLDQILGWELELQSNSGERFPVELGIARMQEVSSRGRGVTMLRWSMLDIRERKAAEEGRRLYEAMVEASNDLMAFVDCGYRYRAVNQRYTEVFGLARDEIVGRAPDVVVGDEQFERIVRPKYDECFSGQSVHYEHWLELPGGARRCFEVRLDPYHATDKTVQGALVDARDVTGRKRAEEEAAHRRAELAHVGRLAIIGELMSSVNHELMQPLTAILGYVRACSRLQDVGEGERLAQALGNIGEQAKRAARITERLRKFGRRAAARRNPIDVNRTIEEMVELFRHDLEMHDVSLRYEFDSALASVPADRVEIQQVLGNLIRNAVDAIKANGSQERAVAIRTTSADDDSVTVSISDTGVGLPDEDVGRLMEPFFTTKPEGTGLGLSISRGIIEAHGGRLWATPNAARGATFHFTLPIELTDRRAS
jgi:PAS domain S-box-containing protein